MFVLLLMSLFQCKLDFNTINWHRTSTATLSAFLSIWTPSAPMVVFACETLEGLHRLENVTSASDDKVLKNKCESFNSLGDNAILMRPVHLCLK